MEEPYKTSEQHTKEWIQEAGLEKPTAGFEMKILQRIASKPLPQKVTPLISRSGWFVLSFIFLMCVLLLYFYPSETLTFKGDRFSGIIPKIDVIKAISLSQTTKYAFLFMALFLVQLPFLKQYLDKQHP